MAISQPVREQMQRSSWVRRMFEESLELRRRHPDRKIFDFSIGNPSLDPPAAFQEALRDIVSTSLPRRHGYMPNAGYDEARQAVAAQVSREQGVALEARHVLMTCGASGAMNVALKSLLDPGDRVLAVAPYFMEYGGYCANHGGTLVPVPAAEGFEPDIEGLAAAITPDTAALIINSPNNPTGRVYSEATIRVLGRMLERRSREVGRPVYLVADEPYRKIVYDGRGVPGVMSAYRNSVVVSSYSKDLSVPGERIGYAAVHPEAQDLPELMDAMILCNRILGYINAPALMQRVVTRLQGQSVDIGVYRRKRDALSSALSRLGYELPPAEGTFYLFPKAPGGDDLKFVEALREQMIIAVPSRGFGVRGYFRLAYCVEDEVIEGSILGFERALQRAGGGARG
jgi:aspartate aminotransferase